MTAPAFEIKKAETRFDLGMLASLTSGLRTEGERVRTLTVDDDAEEQQAAARLAVLKTADAQLRELIAVSKRPFLDVTQALDKMTKAGRDDLAFAIGAYTSIIGAYNAGKLEARRGALAKAQAAARQRDTAAVTQALNVRQENAKQKLDGVAVKLKWLATVVDPEQVPREWCTPDEPAIAAHARGFKENDTPTPIPGVEFQLVGGSTLR